MRCAILGFTAGVLALQQAASLPSCASMGGCLAAALLFAVIGRRRKPVTRGATLACAGILVGYAWAALLAHHALAQVLAHSDEGRDLTVVGVVDSLPYRFEQGLRFNLLVEHADTPVTTVPHRIALSWYAERRGPPSLPVTLLPGERWRLTVRLQRPHGNANPGVWASFRLTTLLSKLQKMDSQSSPLGRRVL